MASAVAFTVAYLPGRRVRVVLPGILGPVVAYFLSGSVLIVAVVHAAIDLVVLLSNDPEDVLERMDASKLDERVLRRVGDE